MRKTEIYIWLNKTLYGIEDEKCIRCLFNVYIYGGKECVPLIVVLWHTRQ